MSAPYMPTDTEINNYSYNSFSGVDIVAQIILPGEKPLVLGELQTISYSTHRENTPVRTLGHVNPVGFVRGPRTIAGSMIFTVFNQYAFNRLKQFQIAIDSGLSPLADMLPLFDVVISFTSEYGALSQMKIYGITVIDEGQTMSVDDLICEQTYTYIAQGIVPMTSNNVDPVITSQAAAEIKIPVFAPLPPNPWSGAIPANPNQ